MGNSALLITSCTHLDFAEIRASVKGKFSRKNFELLTSGFHLMRTSANVVAQISEKIEALGFKQVAPSHCASDFSIAIFENFGHLNLGDFYRF